MAAQYYTIKGVKRGNEWQNSFGTFQSYSLSLEGLGEPVSLNKAVPVKEEPEAGQKLYGTVEMLQSQKGTTYYKFKTEKVPDGEYVAPSPQSPPQGSYEGHSDKEDSIARAVALKAAVEFVSAHPSEVRDDVLDVAEIYLAWLKNDSGTHGAGAYTPKAHIQPHRTGEPLPEPPEDLQELMNFAGDDNED